MKALFNLLFALSVIFIATGENLAQIQAPPMPGQNMPPVIQTPPPPSPGATNTPPPAGSPPPSQPMGTPNSPGSIASPPPPGWGAPGYLANPPAGDWMNQGTLNVMATGTDSEGVMKQIPIVISYTFNGVNYNVTVLNAWDPYTQTWNMGIDMPAYSTDYYLNGFTYNYYAPLSLGTFYFNL